MRQGLLPILLEWRAALILSGMSIYEPILARLNEQGGRYVVVGGLAVVLHGHARLTVDLDLVVDLAPEAARRTISALLGLGFRPLAPVDALDFADAAQRQQWVEEKGMRVFSVYEPESPLSTVDLFVESPIDFEELYRKAQLIPIGNTVVRVVSIPHLIQMKQAAGREQDRADLQALGEIEKRRGQDEIAEPTAPAEDDPWAKTTWEGHAQWQLERTLAATPEQRLAWLEAAIRIAHAAGAIRRPQVDLAVRSRSKSTRS